MTISTENEQSNVNFKDQEQTLRKDNATQLIHDIIGRNQEFFSDADNRLDFLESQDGDSFLGLARYVNAKLRGEKPHLLRKDEKEKGAFLGLLHTPSTDKKPAAFTRGYEAIREYIRDSTDPTEKKVQGVAMATEDLVIWVHPFNDGNGRTSRFLAKLIEQGATDETSLVEETASGNARGGNGIEYKRIDLSREAILGRANNYDLMFEGEDDEPERERMREEAKTLPDDIENTYLNIKQLLEDDEYRKEAVKYLKPFKRVE